MSLCNYIKKINRQRNIKTKKLKIYVKLKYIEIFYRKKKTKLPTYNTVCIFMHGQAIGDSIITSGLISKLKDNGKKVIIVGPEKIRFLFDNMIPIDKFCLFDKKNISELIENLKALHIDLVIDTFDFDHSIMYRLKTLFKLRPGFSIGFDQPNNTIFDINLKSKENTHLSERMKQILKVIGIDDTEYNYSLSFNSENAKISRDYALAIKEKSKLIIFNPFGSEKTRSLSIDQINDILAYLNTLKQYHVVVFNMGVNISCDSFDNVELNPFTDAEQSFSLASNADIIITVDTAIVHLASAFEIKQFCIYNNKIHNKKINSNVLFGPNSINAFQLTTSEFANTEKGDNMHLFDISLLTSVINNEISNNSVRSN